MKSIKDLTNKDAIHTQNKAEAIQLIELFNELGLKWSTGRNYIKEDSQLDHYPGSLCFIPNQGLYASLDYLVNDCPGEYTIHKASDFLRRPQVGDLVQIHINLEVSSAGQNIHGVVVSDVNGKLHVMSDDTEITELDELIQNVEDGLWAAYTKVEIGRLSTNEICHVDAVYGMWDSCTVLCEITPKEIELSLDEIAEKFGVNVNNLKIKK